ncbi:hypothetical protein AF331_12570 [Rossellomorea marisflavi]|uniref:Uncharacterized protein n=1 Tax=Rossellomorea marisflavi TaxID=189381 RepID=A0A0M0G4S0_9BACI|nr:hypothetical protein [Rossellomorea marisflavi]KON84840.1 hypothetical protein AF331_12570 [Rossellomorea marisflavi]
MANVAIYYQQAEEENPDEAVLIVKELIKKIRDKHKIMKVFIDNFGEDFEFMELLNSPLLELDYIYINKPINNDFDRQLLDQLKKTEKFEVVYFT